MTIYYEEPISVNNTSNIAPTLGIQSSGVDAIRITQSTDFPALRITQSTPSATPVVIENRGGGYGLYIDQRGVNYAAIIKQRNPAGHGILIQKASTGNKHCLVIDNSGSGKDICSVSGGWSIDRNGNAVFASVSPAIGSTGLQGETGIQGNQGATGNQGNQGYQGIQGITGLQGIQGNTGIQGVTGLQGEEGPAGLPGVTGGYIHTNEYYAILSMHSLYMAEVQYKLLPPEFRYGNLAELQMAGYIDSVLGSGEKDGYNYWDQYWSTDHFYFHANPITPGETGERYFYIDETGYLRYNFTGPAGPSDAILYDISTMRGETGPQGTTGAQGVQGETGLQGEQGVTGLLDSSAYYALINGTTGIIQLLGAV